MATDPNSQYATTAQVNAAVRQQLMYDANRKSVGVGYLLLIFLGWFGAHRFYLGQTGSGAVQLVLFIVGVATLLAVIGFFILFALSIWLFVDLFLIPGIAREHNMKLADQLTRA